MPGSAGASRAPAARERADDSSVSCWMVAPKARAAESFTLQAPNPWRLKNTPQVLTKSVGFSVRILTFLCIFSSNAGYASLQRAIAGVLR